MAPEQNQSEADSRKMAIGIITFICRSLASTIEVFLHRYGTFGERYLGLQAAAAIPLIFLYTACWPHADVRAILAFLVAYVIALALARLGVFLRRRNGPVVHSFYTGTPRLMRILSRVSELTVKRLIEPGIVLIAGASTLAVNEPLGGYFILAGLALFGTVNASVAFDRVRALNMHDAFIDQSNVTEQFRDMRGQ